MRKKKKKTNKGEEDERLKARNTLKQTTEKFNDNKPSDMDIRVIRPVKQLSVTLDSFEAQRPMHYNM